MTHNGNLHHVEINVSDLSKSRIFYDWFLGELGFKLYQEWEKGFSYRKEETYLVFVQTEPKHLNQFYHRSQTGLNHLAFHADRDLIDKIAKQLPEKGIVLLYPNQHPYAAGPDAYALFMEDPDRIKIECAAY